MQRPPNFIKFSKFTKMEPKDITVPEFNQMFGTSIENINTKDLFLFEKIEAIFDAIKAIEEKGLPVHCIYISKSEIIKAIEEDKRDPDTILLWHIIPIDFYISIDNH